MEKMYFSIVLLMFLTPVLWGQPEDTVDIIKQTEEQWAQVLSQFHVCTGKVLYYQKDQLGVFRFTLQVPGGFFKLDTSFQDYKLYSENEQIYACFLKKAQATDISYEIPEPQIIKDLTKGIKNFNYDLVLPHRDVSPEHYLIYGRFQQSGACVVTLAFRVRNVHGERWRELKTNLVLPADNTPEENAPLFREWVEARNQYFYARLGLEGSESFYEYALLNSEYQYGIPAQIPDRRFNRRNRREADFYSLTTGALAIQETLQLEIMTGPIRNFEAPTVPLAKLQGPTVKSHPFEQMMAGRTPVFFNLAKFVPQDQYYIHFASLTDALHLFDIGDMWGSHLLHAMEVSAKKNDLKEKLQRQLCIETSVMSRMFGNIVIADVAITGRSPFFKEGASFALLFQVKNQYLFDHQMNQYIEQAVKQGAQKSTGVYQDVSYLKVATDDGRISSYSCYLQGVKVYASSLAQLQRIIDTHLGKVPAMSSALDFQYMRTIYPGTTANEDVFVYLSDPFIRELTGPRFKIQNRRRISCINNLRMMQNAVVLYRMENKKDPGWEDVIRERFIDPRRLICSDGGTYKFENGVASCSVHNSIGYITDIHEVSMDAVTPDEQTEYAQFLENYNRYWREFFDPIGIRIRIGNTISLQTCILPLIDNSIYQGMKGATHGEPAILCESGVTPRTIASFGFQFDHDWLKIDREVCNMLEEAPIPGINNLWNWLGNTVEFHFYDNDMLFTVDSRNMGELARDVVTSPGAEWFVGLILSAITLPTYSTISLKDPQMAAQFLAFVEDRVAIEVATQNDREIYISLVREQYKNKEYGVFSITLFIPKFKFYYMVHNNYFVVATKRQIIHDLIDGKEISSANQASFAGNLRFVMRRSAFNLVVEALSQEWNGRLTTACFENFKHLGILYQYYDCQEQNLDQKSTEVYGYSFYCPSGGKYSFDTKERQVKCSIHGHPLSPTQPLEMDPNTPFARFLDRLKNTDVVCRFTPEGLMTEVTLELGPEVAKEK